MRRDPTEFRQRFAAWKNGKLPYKDGLPAYEDGKEDEFDVFLKTLPDNQRAPGAYNTRRYWELNGKPKNFAEAIGIGMYNVQEDNGILGWHANSVSYNDKNDTYEFMKPNYHPTRWMELVYGYDKDQAFQKDWKVQYNGPMLSDRYVRREKPGFKIKGGLLPKFAGGKPAEYVQAGKDNSWARVTNDPMGAVFLNLVIRPKSRGGNTTVGNWNRQWSLKYEKPLESVSPEFDIISGIRGITNLLKPKSNNISTTLKDIDRSHDIAKTPYIYSQITSRDLAKYASNIYDINKLAIRAKIENGHPVAEAYKKIKTFLESPEYRERLTKYYRDKGSSIITQNNAPGDRIGELLYNLGTAKFEVMPRGLLVDSNGLLHDAYGLYEPETHLIQVASDAMSRQTPAHEMWHATRRGMPYLDNAKYSMKTTALREIDNMFEKTLPEEFSSLRIKLLENDARYYSRIEEQEVRILDTLREMQEEGLNINKLTDNQIFDFLYNRPIDSHGTNVLSLIDNYLRDDIPNALRNFKSLFVPATLSSIGYGMYNKYAE